MSGLNKVMLIGRLGKDPELKSTNYGSVCNFSLATSETYKDKTSGEKKETTTWHNIVCWNATADIAGKYLHKGSQVFVEGKLQTRSYDKDGITRYVTEIVVHNLVMLSPKSEGQSGGGYSPPQQAAAPVNKPLPDNNPTDDLPF